MENWPNVLLALVALGLGAAVLYFVFVRLAGELSVGAAGSSETSQSSY